MKRAKVCKYCGRTFLSNHGLAYYCCSPTLGMINGAGTFLKLKTDKHKRVIQLKDRTYICASCGTSYVPVQPNQSGCSEKCRRELKRLYALRRDRKRRGSFEPRECKYCGEAFVPPVGTKGVAIWCGCKKPIKAKPFRWRKLNLVQCWSCRDWFSPGSGRRGDPPLCKKPGCQQQRADIQIAKRRVGPLIRKRELADAIGGCCQRCGYEEFAAGLVFHHVEDRGIDADKSPRTENEIDKCVLLCSNCHNALHSREWGGVFKKAEGLGWVLVEEDKRVGLFSRAGPDWLVIPA